MGLKNKNIKLRTFFVKYLITLFLGFLLILLLGAGLFFGSLKAGLLISVGDVETTIESKKAELASVKTVSKDLIPKTCEYAIVSTTGNFLYGSMTDSDTDIAWKVIQSGRRNSGISFTTGLNAQCYFPIERQDEICIVKYSALSQFSSQWLRQYLPAPEIVLFWVIVAAILSEVFLLSRFYGRKISSKLLPLQKATEKIQNQDLEFKVQYSGIQEIDAALKSLDTMKAELKRSLEAQWKIEHTRKIQLSALAHDIKTPLTVVRGNAEMLEDTNQTGEQKEFTHYILKNAIQMEQYVQMLIELSKAEVGYSLQQENINTKAFLNELYSQIHALASVKRIEIKLEEKDLPETINIDSSLMQRAIMNIAANAVDYSPEGGLIRICVCKENHNIRITVEDSGKGFSAEDLKNALTQFYQGDSSRSSKSHHGMGLFIADSIVKQHDGSLSIANSPMTGGGMVTIEF